jgi:hypothetical protein
MSTTSDLLSSAYKVAIPVAHGEEGYDRMERRQPEGWQPISGWGRNGWDLGSWPYVVISHRHTPEGFELLYDVEGDTSIYRYPTREQRDAATDELAFFHWEGEDWIAGIENAADAPEHLRGPFSWSRLDKGTDGKVTHTAGEDPAQSHSKEVS